MSRVLLALGLAVAAAALWIYSRSMQSDGGSDADTALQGGTEDVEPRSAISSAQAASMRLDAPATEWTVLVVDSAGRRVSDARLVATRSEPRPDSGAIRLEGTGETTWEGPPAGTWTLVASAPGAPTWRRAVELGVGERTRTIVQLANGLTVRGRVVDTRRRPQARHLVGFVPGNAHAPRDPREWLALPHGRTSLDGVFEVRLPLGEEATAERDWRLFVGYGGEIALETENPVRIAVDGPSRVDVVVPAVTRLEVEVRDAPGLPATASRFGVSVYRLAAILDVERPLPPAPVEPPPSREPTDPDEAAEVAAARSAEESDRSNPEIVAASRRRLAVVPEGWRMDKSAFCGADGRVVFEGLPIGEELRFAASRPPEAFRVEGAARIPPAGELLVRLELPEPLEESELAGFEEPRTVLLEVVPSSLSEPALEPGASWR